MTNFIKKVVKERTQRTGVYGLNGFRVNYWEKKEANFLFGYHLNLFGLY